MIVPIFATQLAVAEPHILPILYGPALTMHVGSSDAPWRMASDARRATGSHRFGWAIDFERRQLSAHVGALALDYSRRRRRLGGSFDPRPPRSAAWMASAAYRIASPAGGPLLLQATIGSERRAPMVSSDKGHLLNTRTKDVGLAWTLRDNLSFNGGWHDQSGGGRRGLLDRAIDIGAGSPLSEAGPHVGFALTGGAGAVAGTGWRLGVDAGSYKLGFHDMRALGQPTANDQRVNVSLRLGFR